MFIKVLEDSSTTSAELRDTLAKRGVLSAEKLLALKTKSLALSGKALYHRGDYAEALGKFQEALLVTTATKEVEELSKWASRARGKEAAALRVEKETWARAFVKDRDRELREEEELVMTAAAAAGGDTAGAGAARLDKKKKSVSFVAAPPSTAISTYLTSHWWQALLGSVFGLGAFGAWYYVKKYSKRT